MAVDDGELVADADRVRLLLQDCDSDRDTENDREADPESDGDALCD